MAQHTSTRHHTTTHMLHHGGTTATSPRPERPTDVLLDKSLGSDCCCRQRQQRSLAISPARHMQIGMSRRPTREHQACPERGDTYSSDTPTTPSTCVCSFDAPLALPYGTFGHVCVCCLLLCQVDIARLQRCAAGPARRNCPHACRMQYCQGHIRNSQSGSGPGVITSMHTHTQSPTHTHAHTRSRTTQQRTRTHTHTTDPSNGTHCQQS
jgi:hypothetical protein